MDRFLAGFDDPACLIHGIGNVAREDDGLGWAFVDWLDAKGLCPRAEKRRHYQLFLEDADLIAGFERVLFVDASRETGLRSFRLDPVPARLDLSFTSHALSIPAVMALCKTCFDRVPEVRLLSIRGYAWEVAEGLTARARRNLAAAGAAFEAAQHGALLPV